MPLPSFIESTFTTRREYEAAQRTEEQNMRSAHAEGNNAIVGYSRASSAGMYERTCNCVRKLTHVRV